MRVWFLALFALFVLACSKQEDVIVETAAGAELSPEEIDRDPLALLPSGALVLIRVDTQQMFASEFGQRMNRLAQARMPVPPAAGFEPARDLSVMHIGLYSMQGADFAAVATGRFDPGAIEAAADGTSTTPLGAPLVKTTYAGRTLYVSRNIGFVVLTSRTVLLGNETGIRRALDRIQEGRARRNLPVWMDGLFQKQQAAIVAAVDFETQPAAGAAADSFQFLKGLQTAKILGNFQTPGMNFAGTLSYANAETASNAAASMTRLQQTLQSYSWFMQLAGLDNPIRKLQAQPVDKEAQFVMSLDSKTIEWLINQLANQLGVSSQTIQASTAPALR